MSRLTFDGSVRRGEFVLQSDFPVDAGEVLGILGPNGSGKSTLLGAVSGLFPLTSGTIHLGEQTWDDGQRRIPAGARRIGSMTASGDLFPHLDVLDNVAFGPRARSASKRASRIRARQELRSLDLEHLAERRPHELSSGQAQRVALARALATDPTVLILDEPLSAIDPAGRHELRAALAERAATLSIPILLVTHDPIDALTLADTLLFLEDGVMTQRGTPEQVLQAPRSPFVADIVGLNLWSARRGSAAHGGLIVAPDVTVVSSDDYPPGSQPLHVAFAPTAVSLWPTMPHGSPRNSWTARVRHVETVASTARVHLEVGPAGEAVTLIADITHESVRELRLSPGDQVVATVKATDIRVYS